MFAQLIFRALVRQGIPVVSVSIGDSLNRATWAIQYHPSATAGQRATGDALLLSYDIGTDTAALDEDADQVLNMKAFRALARATFELKTNAWTLVQFSDRIKAIYRNL